MTLPVWPPWRRMIARHRRRAARRRYLLEDDGPDLGRCPYYLRATGVPGYEGGVCFQMGVCANPALMEPTCVTCEPEGGWPSTRYIELGELDYQPVTLQRSTTR